MNDNDIGVHKNIHGGKMKRKTLFWGIGCSVFVLTVGLIFFINLFPKLTNAKTEKENFPISKQEEVTLAISEGDDASKEIQTTESVERNSLDFMSEVPNLVGLTYSEAYELAKDYRLAINLIDDEYSDSFELGQISKQSFETGKKVIEGTVIDVVVSLGEKEITVPYLVGKSIYSKNEALRCLGINLKCIEEENELAPGTIISSSISPGTIIDEKQELVLTISTGLEKINQMNEVVVVPNLVDQPFEKAKKILKEKNLYYSLGAEVFDNSRPYGQIMTQSIEADTEVKAGTTIILRTNNTVSSTEVPQLVGNNINDVLDELKNNYYDVDITYVSSNDYTYGEIISSIPIAGTEVPLGSQIRLSVCSGYTESNSQIEKQIEEMSKTQSFFGYRNGQRVYFGPDADQTVIVPNIVGMKALEAFWLLEENKLTSNPHYIFSEMPAGRVCSQSYEPGSEAKIYTEINVALSMGQEYPTVPNLVGMRYEDAYFALLDLGLSTDYIIEAFDKTVTGMAIEAGTVVKNLTNISLTYE